MTSDPSPLFLAAALTAGLIEGSSVIRNFRHYALPPNDDGNSNDNNNNDNDGRNNISDEYDGYGDDSIAAPSASTIIAHSILYGVTSVPLGIVGASPGLIFLPKFKSSSLSSSRIKKYVGGGNPAAIEYAMDEKEERTVHNANHQHTLNYLSETYDDDNIPIVGTGRGVGRKLRHENSKKMMLHNKRQRHLGGMELGKRNQTKIGCTNTVTPRPSTYTSVSSRYIATLDGKALPIPLAEAMRRMRFIFVGAGIVSYAITTRHNTNMTKNHHRHDNNGMESRHHPTYAATYYSYGYNHWIMNTKSIRLWNERIKDGKSMDEIDLLKRWKVQQNNVNDESIVHEPFFGILSNEGRNYQKAQEVIFGGIYNTTKWMHVQLGRDLDEPPFGWVRHWKIADSLELTNGEPNIGEESTQSGSRVHDDDKVTEQEHAPSSSKSGSEQQSPNSSPVWNAAVTSVDVLGTSVRHLVVSTYKLATTVVTAGRQGKRAPKDNDVDGK